MTGNDPASIRVKVSGALALFTSPAAKVERLSYMAPTPSSARGVLDSILWKPEMRWHITAIEVLRPIRYIALKRNELQSKTPVKGKKGVQGWMVDPDANYSPRPAGAGSEDVTQRNSQALKDVAYIIEAVPIVYKPNGENTPQKYKAMIERRVEKGQCYKRPYLGCREFAAEVSPPEPEDSPLPIDMDLGAMLYDIIFDPHKQKHQAVFFPALLKQGRINTRVDDVIADPELRRRVLACSYSH